MILNASKCHLLFAGYIDELLLASVGDALLCEKQSAWLLGILINSSLKFDDYVKVICKKTSQKLTAISRMSNFMSQEKRQSSIRTSFESQFDYCPLMWVFCGRTLNHRIYKVHERAFRIADSDYTTP